jgi:N-acyl-phosphatidylethanolamine-hydrolysing phospholipase D
MSEPNDSNPLYAAHHAAGGFFNPWEETQRGLRDALRWKLARNPYDKSVPPRVPRVANDGAYLGDPRAADSVTWVGHSSFAIQDAGEVLLTDPHWGARALLPRRHAPPGIPLSAVPDTALAIVSHNHYDHLDAWTVARLPAGVSWFAPLGLADWLLRRRRRDGGRPEGATAAGPAVVRELDWWQSTRLGRWTLTCLPAQHWSNRFGVRRNSSLWCSWLVDSGRRRYYFAGDSGYFGGFAEIGRRFAPIDLALLPIGAYEPRWFMRYAHMNPAEAYQACRELGAAAMVPMHWGTFDLTDEPLDLPPQALADAVTAAHGNPGQVHTLAIGERWLLP